jgi:protein-disulfide isomerase
VPVLRQGGRKSTPSSRPPNDVRLIFKQYPLESHPQASISAAAALAAHQQGKFWQMHDILFANRTKLAPGGSGGRRRSGSI